MPSHLLIASGLGLTSRQQCSDARTVSIDPEGSGRHTAAHGCVDLQNAALAMQSEDVRTPRADVCVRTQISSRAATVSRRPHRVERQRQHLGDVHSNQAAPGFIWPPRPGKPPCPPTTPML